MKSELEKLIDKFNTGDQTAFCKLLNDYYMEKITRIAKKYKYFFPHLFLDDLIEEGIEGLYQSVKNWDRKKDFSRYSMFYIKRKIKNYVFENLTLIKIPSYFLKNLKKIIFFINKNENQSITEIAKKTKVEIEKVKDILIKQPQRNLSFDDYLDKQEKQETLYDIIPDLKSKLPLDSCLDEEKIKILDCILDKLNFLEKEVIKWRFGLKDKKHHTIKSIAKILKLKPYKVKEIETIAIAKLKKICLEEE